MRSAFWPAVALPGIVCSRLPGALALETGRWRSQPGAIAVAIARHLQISLAEEAAGDGPARFPPEPPWRRTRMRSRGGTGSIRGSARWLSALRAVPRNGPVRCGGADHLDRRAVLGLLPARQRASEPIDITGRARRIIEGPHIVLPAGAWSLTLTLSCTREAAEHEFPWKWRPTVRSRGTDTAASRRRYVTEPRFRNRRADRLSCRDPHSTVRAAFDGAITVVTTTLCAPRISSPAASPPRFPDRRKREVFLPRRISRRPRSAPLKASGRHRR